MQNVGENGLRAMPANAIAERGRPGIQVPHLSLPVFLGSLSNPLTRVDSRNKTGGQREVPSTQFNVSLGEIFASAEFAQRLGVTPENKLGPASLTDTAPQPCGPWTYAWRWNNRTGRILRPSLIAIKTCA
jgi:hypothetical protein